MNKKIMNLVKNAILMGVTLALVMLVFIKTEVTAAPVYEKINMKSEMMVGQTEIYTFVSWTLNGKSNHEKIYSTTVVKSSNPAVLQATVEHKVFEDKSDLYSLRLTALKAGTSTLTVNFGDNEVIYDIHVIDMSTAVIEAFPVSKDMDKGSSYKLETHYNVTCGSFSDMIWMNECEITSSNTNIVTVTQSGYTVITKQLNAVAPGTATITLKVTKDCELKGLTKSFQVKVTEGPAAKTPYMVPQYKHTAHAYSNRIIVGFKIMQGEMEYEIYRSTSKKKGFKKVKTYKMETFSSPGQPDNYYVNGTLTYNKTGDIYEFDNFDKKLKANKQYYYKIRARYTDSYHNNGWSKFSKAQGFWTSPATIKNSKISYNSGNGRVVFPKVKMKNMVGYYYAGVTTRLVGYNIFGGAIYNTTTKTNYTKKRKFIAPKMNEYGTSPKNASYPDRIEGVCPIVKHGKYYYTHGGSVTKKLSAFRTWNVL